MIETIYQVLMFCVGCMVGILIDSIWWNIDYSKYEKGFEILEHYHFGFIIGILGIITSQAFFFGIMLMLFLKESEQTHPFASNSGHFKDSTLIGIGTFIFLLCVLIVWII